MLRLRIEDVKRFCKLAPNEIVVGSDGRKPYMIVRRGKYLEISER